MIAGSGPQSRQQIRFFTTSYVDTTGYRLSGRELYAETIVHASENEIRTQGLANQISSSNLKKTSPTHMYTILRIVNQ